MRGEFHAHQTGVSQWIFVPWYLFLLTVQQYVIPAHAVPAIMSWLIYDFGWIFGQNSRRAKRTVVKELAKKAGLPGFYSNRSLRSTSATK